MDEGLFGLNLDPKTPYRIPLNFVAYFGIGFLILINFYFKYNIDNVINTPLEYTIFFSIIISMLFTFTTMLSFELYIHFVSLLRPNFDFNLKAVNYYEASLVIDFIFVLIFFILMPGIFGLIKLFLLIISLILILIIILKPWTDR